MNTLICSAPMIKSSVTRSKLPDSGFGKVLKRRDHSSFPCVQFRSLRLRCTNLVPWESSSQYAPTRDAIIDSIEAEETQELPILQSENDAVNTSNQISAVPRLFKWPMWLLGPSVLLGTGMVPTLWLPLSSVFLGANIAGLLSLVGLDCIFNMGATLFLLMADACARPKGSSFTSASQVPLTYKLWNLGASIAGLLVPMLMLFGSYRGFLLPHIPFISFSVLFGPYLLLLSTQMLIEMLTWHWKSPVWLMTPIVYESYRILQLMRGLRLVTEGSSPLWAVESIRVLVMWWVLVLGVQLMRVAWFAGAASRSKQAS